MTVFVYWKNGEMTRIDDVVPSIGSMMVRDGFMDIHTKCNNVKINLNEMLYMVNEDGE